LTYPSTSSIIYSRTIILADINNVKERFMLETITVFSLGVILGATVALIERAIERRRNA